MDNYRLLSIVFACLEFVSITNQSTAILPECFSDVFSNVSQIFPRRFQDISHFPVHSPFCRTAQTRVSVALMLYVET